MYDRLFLGVLGSKHEGYVGGEEVIHLVGQGRLQGQLGEGGRVPDGEAEAGGGAGPVHDVGQGEGGQHVLQEVTG